MFTYISILLTLVLIFGAGGLIGLLGRLRRSEHRAEAAGDRERAEALRKVQSDIDRGRFYSRF